MINLLEGNAERFKALGHPVRLGIVRLLVQGHPDGTPVGAIQAAILPGSLTGRIRLCTKARSAADVGRAATNSSLPLRAIAVTCPPRRVMSALAVPAEFSCGTCAKLPCGRSTPIKTIAGICP